jgi:chromosome segregation ATPase
MTQANDPSRLDRLEALMLEIAASNLRHDRDIDRVDERITQHEQWQVQHEQRIAEHEEWQRQHEASMQRHEERMERIETQQELNIQAIAQFTAGLVELRVLVSDYIQGRSQIQGQ